MGGGGFIIWPREPYPADCCGSLPPLGDPDRIPDRLLTPKRFPRRAWNPDLLALVVLGDFGCQPWRDTITLAQPQALDHPDMLAEVRELVRLSRDERPGLVGEIRDQDTRFHDYFAHLLMMSPQSHFETFNLFKMAARVAEMLMTSYKLEHERPRPQQAYPALLPLLDLPGHSSYPSGHALISRMIAACLAEVAPDRRDALFELADRIAHNREVAGLHYPSDTRAGVAIADQAFPLLQACPSYKRVRDYARDEWK